MRRRYKIYRGNQLLGYVGFDEASPCEPFEPAEAFFAVEALFIDEYETLRRACELPTVDGGQSELAHSLFQEADRLQAEILAPGVRFEAMEPILASFDCIGLSIYDGRVCWR